MKKRNEKESNIKLGWNRHKKISGKEKASKWNVVLCIFKRVFFQPLTSLPSIPMQQIIIPWGRREDFLCVRNSVRNSALYWQSGWVPEPSPCIKGSVNRAQDKLQVKEAFQKEPTLHPAAWRAISLQTSAFYLAKIATGICTPSGNKCIKRSKMYQHRFFPIVSGHWCSPWHRSLTI